jgi:hypothetical protein
MCAIASGRVAFATTVVDVVDEPRRGHRLAAPGNLFCGLEEDAKRPLEVARSDRLEHPERDGDVCVVTARVHVPVVFRPKPLVGRAVAGSRRLRHRDAVHVDADADRRPRTPLDGRYDACMSVVEPLEEGRVDAGVGRPVAPRAQRLGGRQRHTVRLRQRLGADGDVVDADSTQLLNDPSGRLKLTPAGFGTSVEGSPERREAVAHVVCHRSPNGTPPE